MRWVYLKSKKNGILQAYRYPENYRHPPVGGELPKVHTKPHVDSCLHRNDDVVEYVVAKIVVIPAKAGSYP